MKKTLLLKWVIILFFVLASEKLFSQYDVPTNYSTINAAIAAAPAGSTINVAPGIYPENIILNKSLTINGAKSGVDARGRVTGAPNPAIESIISGAVGGTSLLDLQTGCALSIINGFTFLGGGGLGTIGAIRSSTGPIDGIQLLNNHIAGFSDAAIWFNRGGIDITISQNVMDGSGMTSGSQIIFLNGPQTFSGLRIVSNWIQNGGSRAGLFVDGVRNVNAITRTPWIKDNIFRGNNVGANIGGRSYENADIVGNSFLNNNFDGLQGGPKNSIIFNNTFRNNGRNGLALTSFSTSTDPTRGAQGNNVTCNLFTNNGFNVTPNSGSGIFLSSTQPSGTISTKIKIIFLQT